MYPGEDVVCMCGSLFSCCFAFSHCHVGYVVILFNIPIYHGRDSQVTLNLGISLSKKKCILNQFHLHLNKIFFSILFKFLSMDL